MLQSGCGWIWHISGGGESISGSNSVTAGSRSTILPQRQLRAIASACPTRSTHAGIDCDRLEVEAVAQKARSTAYLAPVSGQAPRHVWLPAVQAAKIAELHPSSRRFLRTSPPLLRPCNLTTICRNLYVMHLAERKLSSWGRLVGRSESLAGQTGKNTRCKETSCLAVNARTGCAAVRLTIETLLRRHQDAHAMWPAPG